MIFIRKTKTKKKNVTINVKKKKQLAPLPKFRQLRSRN